MFSQAEDSLRFTAHPRFVLEATAVRATRLLRRPEILAQAPPPAATTASGPKTLTAHPPAKPGPATPSMQPSATAAPATVRPALPLEPRRTTAFQSSQEQPAPPVAPAVTAPAVSPKPILAAPAPKPAPAQTPAEAQIPDSSSTLNWDLVLEEVAASFPNFAPFLETGRYVGLEGNHVTIGFGKQSALARSMLEKEDNLRALASLCEKQVGHPIKIRVVELSEADPPGPTMAQLRATKEQEQRLVLFEQARANPVVKQALEIFGADLADVRTLAHKEASE